MHQLWRKQSGEGTLTTSIIIAALLASLGPNTSEMVSAHRERSIGDVQAHQVRNRVGGINFSPYDLIRLQRVSNLRLHWGFERHEGKFASDWLDDSFVLAEADGSQANHPETRRYHYSTQPLEVVDGLNTGTPQARLLGNDAQGSVSDFIDFTGSITAIRQYDAWGNFRQGTAPAIGEAALAYTGHQFDAETGLIYARARYYDSEYGIFLSRDTVEGNGADAPSLHRYLYTKGNPLRYVDPSGRVGLNETPGYDTNATCNALGGCSQAQRSRVYSFYEYVEAKAVTRIAGLMEVVGGAVEAVSGGASAIFSPEPLTKAGGVVLAAHGLDMMQAGAQTIWTGDLTPSQTNRLAQRLATKAGVPDNVAPFVGAFADVAVSGAPPVARALKARFGTGASAEGTGATVVQEGPALELRQTLLGPAAGDAALEAQVKLATEKIPGLTPEQARVILKEAAAKDSTAVFGGSRVRGNFRPDSDLDVGFGSLTENQAVKLIKKAEKAGPLKLEKLQIVPGKSTPNIPKIQSPEEFFQRSGTRAPTDPRAGEPYEPSGSSTVPASVTADDERRA